MWRSKSLTQITLTLSLVALATAAGCSRESASNGSPQKNQPTSNAAAEQSAAPAPVPVSQYVYDPSPVANNPDEMDVTQVANYLQEKANEEAQAAGIDVDDYVRIKNFDPSTGNGKVIIKVYGWGAEIENLSTSTPKPAEYLEVFRQNSADPNDLSPLNLFDKGASNKALVSTAGSFVIGGVKKKFTTPTGTFAIDRLEKLHISHTYNDAPMPFSMFFNEGIAIHAATPGEYKNLGKEASHGCVRTHLDTAQALYQYVETQPGGDKNVVIEIIEEKLPDQT